MKKQVTCISVHQSSKLIGVLYFMLSCLICIPTACLAYLTTQKIEWLAITLLPFAYWICGYALVAVICGVYNFAAKHCGGLEYETAEVECE